MKTIENKWNELLVMTDAVSAPGVRGQLTALLRTYRQVAGDDFYSAVVVEEHVNTLRERLAEIDARLEGLAAKADALYGNGVPEYYNDKTRAQIRKAVAPLLIERSNLEKQIFIIEGPTDSTEREATPEPREAQDAVGAQQAAQQ